MEIAAGVFRFDTGPFNWYVVEDHLGFSERLRKATGAPVYVHAADASAAKRALQLPWRGLLGNAWRPYVASMLGTATGNGDVGKARPSPGAGALAQPRPR